MTRPTCIQRRGMHLLRDRPNSFEVLVQEPHALHFAVRAQPEVRLQVHAGGIPSIGSSKGRGRPCVLSGRRNGTLLMTCLSPQAEIPALVVGHQHPSHGGVELEEVLS